MAQSVSLEWVSSLTCSSCWQCDSGIGMNERTHSSVVTLLRHHQTVFHLIGSLGELLGRGISQVLLLE